jgi:hypothetical protein
MASGIKQSGVFQRWIFFGRLYRQKAAVDRPFALDNGFPLVQPLDTY